MKRVTRWTVTGLLLLIAASVLTEQNEDRSARPASAHPAASPQASATPQRPAEPTATVAPAEQTPVPSDLADARAHHHHDDEAPARPRRPLRALLPIELAGTRIEPVAGAGDVVRIVPGDRGRRAARALYQRALAATTDRTRYRIRWGR